jgi:putative ubiquitin-RnfH superfamily antitoxin RatB of RatAB toxin-antitoxin module
MADDAVLIRVQVCYARPDGQILHDLTVPAGTNLNAAVMQSGILAANPEIDLSVTKVGIHGKLKTLDTLLREGDRIEIYRPLQADPKEARRRRARAKT